MGRDVFCILRIKWFCVCGNFAASWIIFSQEISVVSQLSPSASTINWHIFKYFLLMGVHDRFFYVPHQSHPCKLVCCGVMEGWIVCPVALQLPTGFKKID